MFLKVDGTLKHSINNFEEDQQNPLKNSKQWVS